MHRDEWSDVSAVESRYSLQESSRSLHELYLRRRQPGADVAAKRDDGPVVSQVYTRSHRLRAYFARQCAPNNPTRITDHPRTDALQT